MNDSTDCLPLPSGENTDPLDRMRRAGVHGAEQGHATRQAYFRRTETTTHTIEEELILETV